MRIPRISIVLAAACLASAGCATFYETRPTASNPDAAAQEAQARKYFEDLSHHDFAAAYGTLNEEQQADVSLEAFQTQWLDREDKWGKLLGIDGVRAQPYGKGWVAIVVCHFPSDVHTLTLIYDKDGKVRGRFNNPLGSAAMFIEALGHHRADWADLVTDGRMHELVPRYKLDRMWTEIEDKLGTYESIASVQPHGLYSKVYAIFGHSEATFYVGVDSRGMVNGYKLVMVGEEPPKSPKPRREKQPADVDR